MDAVVEDWERAGQYIKLRRAAKCGRQQDAAERTRVGGVIQVSVATWRKLERGDGPFDDRTLVQAEIALEWPFGTIRKIAAGGEPPPDPEPERNGLREQVVATLRGDVAHVADEQEQIKLRLKRLEDAVADLFRRGDPGRSRPAP